MYPSCHLVKTIPYTNRKQYIGLGSFTILKIIYAQLSVDTEFSFRNQVYECKELNNSMRKLLNK